MLYCNMRTLFGLAVLDIIIMCTMCVQNGGHILNWQIDMNEIRVERDESKSYCTEYYDFACVSSMGN